MPELPEVETVRAGLAREIIGRQIAVVIPGDFPGVVGDPGFELFAARVVDRTIARVDRRGKYLILRFDDGDGVIIHLRMTGVLEVAAPATPLPRFHHLTLRLDNEQEIRFSDQRKFGRVLAASSDEIAALDQKLGPEPLDSAFTPDRLAHELHNRRAPVKSLLLDQKRVAGLGNIYVDEALFKARIHPLMPGGNLDREQCLRLHTAIRDVLSEGLRNRGTTFSSFRDAHGAPGTNQQHLAVYGRVATGSVCINCGTPLQRIVIGGRGTHFCPVCQPEP